jgi:hypothetical protein
MEKKENDQGENPQSFQTKSKTLDNHGKKTVQTSLTQDNKQVTVLITFHSLDMIKYIMGGYP